MANTYISGNDGVVTGPAFAADVTRFEYNDQCALPDTGAMGDARDSHVVGPKGPATATIDFLMGTETTWTSAGIEAGVTGIAVVLKNSDVIGNCVITGTATIQSVRLGTTDRRGVSAGQAVVKFEDDVAITEEV